jgi:hypothetical protein
MILAAHSLTAYPNAVFTLWLLGNLVVWFCTAGMFVARALVLPIATFLLFMPAIAIVGSQHPRTVAATTGPTEAPASSEGSRPAGYVSRIEYGDAWPLTVDEGVLVCDQSRSALGAVVFSTGDRRYGVNGTAKSQGIPPIDPIWRTTTLALDYPALTRVPEDQRRRIFGSVVTCQDAGSGSAHDEACLVRARERFKLTAVELTRITSEGVSMRWPPLTPARVNIGPLIDRGLKLCDGNR